MLRFHKSNACLSGKDALAAFFPGQTYATPAIQAAMRDCAARSALPLTVPAGRYHQLRQVLRLMAEKEKASEAELLPPIMESLQVSEPVARSLLLESQTLFQS